MKVLAVFLLLAVAHSQAQTVTEDLLAAQRELTVGHEFAEVYVIQNRVLLSDYLARIEVFVLDHFMEAYARIKITGLATREEMESFVEPSFCKDAVRARWELQMTRYGQRLSQCLGITSDYLFRFTGTLNDLHRRSRYYSNLIPNVGLSVLSELNIFTGRDNLRTYINNSFRDLFFVARAFQQEFGDFVQGISIELDPLLEQYTQCYRELPIAFDIESRDDLERIRMCYSD